MRRFTGHHAVVHRLRCRAMCAAAVCRCLRHERRVRKRSCRTVGSGRSSAAGATSAAACSNSASSRCVSHPSARGATAVSAMSAMATCNGGDEHAWRRLRRIAVRTSRAQLEGLPKHSLSVRFCTCFPKPRHLPRRVPSTIAACRRLLASHSQPSRRTQAWRSHRPRSPLSFSLRGADRWEPTRGGGGDA